MRKEGKEGERVECERRRDEGERVGEHRANFAQR
jgi:hypothetical protein